MKTLLTLLSVLFLFPAVCLDAQTLDEQFPTVNGQVKTIHIHGNTIYIGGTFTQVGGLPRTNIAAIDITTKTVTPWALTLNGDVVDIAAANGKVYFCGHFTQVNSSNRNALASVDSTSGMVETLNPAIVFPGIPSMQTGTVSSVKVVDNLLYFAGYFISVNGTTRANVAALDLPSGTLNAFSVTPNIPVNLIETEGNTLYLGGPFNQVNGVDRKGFAAVNRINGNLLPWDPSSDDPGNTIYGIVPDGDSVIISGIIFNLNGSGHCFLAKTDLAGAPAAWSPFSCNTFPLPFALAKSGSSLIVGGEFPNFNGVNRQNLAMAHRNTGVVNDWNPAPDDDVLALGVNDSLIAVGGKFAHISGVTRPNFVVYRKEQEPTNIAEPAPAVVKINGFPNPTRSIFRIPIPENEVRNIRIYSRDGKKINTGYQVDAQWLSIRTEALPAGEYIVQFETKGNQLFTSAFIKVN